MIKNCKICHIDKDLIHFYVGRNQCKECFILKNKHKRMPIEYYKEYWQKNKEMLTESHSNYLKNNKEAVAKNKHTWYTNNKQHSINKRIELNKRKLINDPIYKLKVQIRARFARAVKKNYKAGSAITNLGCSIEELRKYLESKFQPGMTWDNHGVKGWHIDHILPLCKFDLSDIEQLKIACHYTNLQPLWWQDNLKKGNK